MLGERFAQWLRFGAVALFSMVLASCGGGSGEDSIDPSADEAAAAEMRLVFADYFGDPPAAGSKAIAKAPLPAGNWVVDTGYGPNDDGNGNDEWQLYTNSMENVFTENGNLVLRAQCTDGACNAPANKRNGTITSGKILSKDRVNVQFGNVRARIKMPSGGGMWPAFWMLGADIDQRPWPDAGEIDIVELFYYFSDNRTTHFTAHWAGPPREDGKLDSCSNPANIPIDPNEVQRCKTASKEFKAKDGFPPLTDDFHVFELEWNEGSIIGKIDGITYYTLAIDASTMEEFLKDYFMILNVAVGGTLGGQQGPWMTVSDWSDPNQTDMLVDWVEVWERVPATSATLIDETGKNIRYNGILNSINSGGGLVEVDLTDVDVPALVGSETMSIRFSNTFTGVPGSRPVTFSGATFDFSGKNLADFDQFVFSVDSSRFAGFSDIGVEFTDRNGNKLMIRTGNYRPVANSGAWRTYSIPLADFPGIDMNNIVGIGFFNPYDVGGNLLAGTLYFDDIRFSASPECNAASSIAFDQVNYNPDTIVAAVYVNDRCAANRQVLVKAENAFGEIFVPARLDAAGNGRAIINLGKSDADECLANDTTAVLQLTPPLLASYNRPMAAKGGANSSFATAGVDAGAPVTTITGDSKYILATSEPTSFIPEQDFLFSDFGTGSQFNGGFSDTTFDPVFSISNGPNSLAQMALFNFISGFTRSTGAIEMKVKSLPDNTITVKFGNTVNGVAPENTYTVNVTTDPEATLIGDGWYLVSIPMDNFADPDKYNYVVFASNTTANVLSFLITDIVLQERVGNLPAACAVEGGGGGGGTATGGSVPEVSIYEADGSVADLSPTYDPFTSGTGIATVMDSSYTQALELTSADGYTVSLVQLGLYPLTFTGYDEFLFKVKGLTADNTIVVKVEATGGGVVNVDVTNPPANVTTEDLGDGWTQVIMNLSAFGDVSSSSQIVFQTLDNAYAVGEKILLTDIGFNNAGGGGTATGGSVPEVSIYEADGSVADLSPTYDPFTSGTGIATVMDSSYTQALELTSADGYTVSLVQLGLYPLTFTGYDEFLFKVKGLTADNTIVVKVEATGGGVVNVDVTNPPANVTTEDLGDGWTQVIMNLSAFGDVSSSSQIVFQTLDNAYAVGEKILLTDIGFNNAGGGGTATGGSVSEVSIYEADGSVADLSPTYDPFTSGTGIATVMDSSYTQALELTSADGYTVSLVQLGLYPLTFTGYDEFLFKVKGLTADNTIVVKVEATGGGVVNVDVTNPPANVTTEDLGDGWTQVIMNLSAFGDVSSSSQIVFQTLDNAYAVGEKILLTDIGFNNAGGGSGSGEQLAVNGDLEAGNGDLSGWTLTPNNGSITSVDDQDSGSTWAVKVSSVPANGTAFSLDGLGLGTVQPGDTLDVSFDMCAVTADGGEIAVAVLSEPDPGSGAGAVRDEIFRSATPASVWTRYNFSTTAGANVDGGVSLQFDVVCGGASTCVADAYLDNVSITLGGGPVAGSSTGASCAAPPAPGVMLPIEFEDGPYVFADFGGGQASVEANSQSGGINVSANVGKMLKFADQVFGGSTFDLGGILTVPANSSFVMKVWSARPVPVLFKLEGGPAAEVTANHAGGSVWEELIFDFTGMTTGDHNGITFIFDNGVNGAAATDPGNWTFYFDDIDFAPAPPAPNVTLFADAFAPGWVGFLDATGTVTVVTDSDSTYGEVLELTTGGSTVVGITTRALDGGDGSTIDTSRFAVLEFDLKLVTAPTSNPALWEAKLENPSGTVAIATPVLDTWVHYSIPISSFGTPNALDLLMLFPEYGANAGAVYRVDNIELLEEASPPPPEDITLFADALAPGWVGFLDANGTVTQVTDSDSTYGEVLELTTGGSTVVGITTRALDGGDGSTIDTNGYAVLEFDLKLVTAPTSNPTLWEAKLENPSGTVAIATPVLDTWVHYSIPIGSFGTPNALDLLMLFPEYGANAGAVYRVDNVMLLVEGPGGGGNPGDELVVNGDFETNGLENWLAITNPNGGTIVTDAVEVSPNNGSTVSVKMTSGPGNNPVLKQERFAAASLTANASVTVEFDIFGSLGAGSVLSIQLITEGGAVVVEDLIPPNSNWTSGWANYSFTTNVGGDVSGGISLQFVAIGGAGTMTLNVDNVSIVLN